MHIMFLCYHVTTCNFYRLLGLQLMIFLMNDSNDYFLIDNSFNNMSNRNCPPQVQGAFFKQLVLYDSTILTFYFTLYILFTAGIPKVLISYYLYLIKLFDIFFYLLI